MPYWGTRNFQKVPQEPPKLRIVYTMDYHYTSSLPDSRAYLLYNVHHAGSWKPVGLPLAFAEGACEDCKCIVLFSTEL